MIVANCYQRLNQFQLAHSLQQRAAKCIPSQLNGLYGFPCNVDGGSTEYILFNGESERERERERERKRDFREIFFSFAITHLNTMFSFFIYGLFASSYGHS